MELIYIWIKDYRNIYKQGFNLSSKWRVEFDEDEKSISINPNPIHIKGFFPNGITNVIAIVGENGAGKSNLLTFIGDWVGVHKCKEECFYIIREDQRLHILYHSSFGFDDTKINCQDSELQVELNPFRLEPKNKEEVGGWTSEGNGHFWVNGKENLLKIFYANTLDGKNDISSSLNLLFDISSNYRLLNPEVPEGAKQNDYSQYDLYQNKDIESVFSFLASSEFASIKKEGDTNKEGEESIFSFNIDAPKVTLELVNPAPLFTSLTYEVKNYISNNTRKTEWGLKQFEDHFNNKASALDELFQVSSKINNKEDVERFLLKELLLNFLFNLGKRYATLNSSDSNGEIPHNLKYKLNLENFNSAKEYLLELWSLHEEDRSAKDLVELISEILIDKEKNQTLFIDFDYKTDESGNTIKPKINLSEKEYKAFRSSYHANFLSIFKHKGSESRYAILDRPVSFSMYSWSYFSTGELAMAQLFSRIFEAKNIDSTTHGHLPSWEKIDSILLLLDEAELGFHPQWQKQFLDKLLRASPSIYTEKHIQIILTSHSPFILSDLTDDHVVFVRKGTEKEEKGDISLKGKCIKEPPIERTFAANIHGLFTHSFFLNDEFIGESARKKLRKMISYLGGNSSSNENIDDPLISASGIKLLIEKVGEPIIREKLWELYRKKYKVDLIDERIKELRGEIERLEQQKTSNND